MTAEQRRAAGEAEFCDCDGCVRNVASYLLDEDPGPWGRALISTSLRATVFWTLLFGWGEP